jgi:predicted transcriptional regulator of viral defense system
MSWLTEYADAQLAKGRGYFVKDEALRDTGQSSQAFDSAIARLTAKNRLVSPRRGFYLILRPEERALGAPDPARWIDPLMRHLKVDYRVSLLRASAFHGSTHQAAMVFQVITPRQERSIAIGRQRVEFIYQAQRPFGRTNRPQWLSQLKTEAGFAKVAGVELTLLDTCRYFHRAAGIGGAAQVVHDLGQKAKPRVLTEAAAAYENSAVRRLGFLLERFGHERQARALRGFADKAKSFKPLDPAAKPLVPGLSDYEQKDTDWKLVINVPVEIDM